MRNMLILLLLPFYLYAEVGQILAMRGEVFIVRNGSNIAAKSGVSLEKQDTIKTSKKSKAQIKLKDDTTVTIGKDTVFKIEDYKFDGTSNSKASLKVMKGMFSTITGKIGKVAKNRFKLKTKTSSIGIRGTHFIGLIDDKKETVACVRGAITITAGGKTVDVPAGQVSSFKSGSAPSAPRKLGAGDINMLKLDSKTMNKIKSAVLYDENGNLDKEQLNELFEDISSIKDENTYYQAYDAIISVMISQYDATLGLENQIDVTQQYNAGTEDIKWGFFKQDDVQKDTLTLETISTLEDDELRNTLKSVNYSLEMLKTTADGVEETPVETIAQKMGGVDPLTQTTYSHWDGSSDNSRKIATYSGNILGTVAYGFDGQNGLKMIDTQTNEAKFVIDYSSGILQGNIYYEAKTPNGDTQERDGDFTSIGHYSVKPSSFDVINKDATTSSIKTLPLSSRYYGDDAQTISGYFMVAHEDYFGPAKLPEKLKELEGTGAVVEETSEESTEQTKWGVDQYYESAGENTEDFNLDGVGFGVYVAKKTSEIELVKKGTMTEAILKSKFGIDIPLDFEYGYWAKDDFDVDSFLNNGVAVDELGISGAWVKANIAQTAEDTINQYIENSVQASYNGSVIGTVHTPDIVAGTNYVSPINSGTVGINFDFGQNRVDGNMNFKANGNTWDVNFNRGAINSDGFIFHNVEVDTDNVVTYHEVGAVSDTSGNEVAKINTLEGSGKFYGQDASNVAGGFKLGTDQNSFAVGAFTADKQ
jgi:hypothetical protein